MENSFKNIGDPPREVPKGLKKEVVRDISSFKLFTDFFDLFFNDFGRVAESIFKKK